MITLKIVDFVRNVEMHIIERISSRILENMSIMLLIPKLDLSFMSYPNTIDIITHDISLDEVNQLDWKGEESCTPYTSRNHIVYN